MTQIIIRGLTRPEEVTAVNEAKPDYVSFDFIPGSRRQVTAEQAASLKAALDPAIQVIGVFSNAPQDEIVSLCRGGVIDVVQLHGEEDEFFETLIKVTVPNRLLHTVRVQSTEQISKADIASPADALVLELPFTDDTFDSGLIPDLRHSFFVSGRLEEETVLAAIEAIRPVGVILSTGLETGGVLDPEKIRRVTALIRAHDMPPKQKGRFGAFGGQCAIPDALQPALDELEHTYQQIKTDEAFQTAYMQHLCDLVNRPSPLYLAQNMSRELGGARIYLKREDLNHTGSHCINSVLGQALVAKKMGRSRLVSETVSGSHALACATAAAVLDMECTIYAHEDHAARLADTAARMNLLGAQLRLVQQDPTETALQDWAGRTEDTLYLSPSVTGPHPYPAMVRDFQSFIGEELKIQMMELEGRQPDVLVACVGGGANALGTFYPYLGTDSVRLIGCEAAARGLSAGQGTVAQFYGMKTLFRLNPQGRPAAVRSVAAGLESTAVGPEHAQLAATGRVEYRTVSDRAAVEAFAYLARTEGIFPSLESAHAVACARELAPTMKPEQILVVTLSGRGEQDVSSVTRFRAGDART